MARRPATDERQANFFGIPAPEPAAPDARPGRPSRTKRDAKRWLPSSGSQDAIDGDSLDALAARLSPAEIDELAAALPDDALAHLILAAVRQLRRRLARSGRRGGGGRASALERAARQLVTELGEQAGDDA
ncbi:MAG: hypothetical protein JO157_11440 [Acetobacteraceae bacterium]|nr:hypothetical protein [Acetobacteraceae bacterium]